MDSTTSPLNPGIFIMMKYPEVGKVKSRLAKSIGEEAATGLYRAFILDTLTTLQSLDVPFHIAAYPPDSKEQFTQWLGTSHWFFPQQGANLGERLQNGFTTMFKKGYKQVIALASDSPDLPIKILQTAVSSLQTHKVVIGPATDGGYYLIGFSQDHSIPTVFNDMSWGTAAVFQETMVRIKSITNQVHVLQEWLDIDTKSQLKKFYETYKLQSSNSLHAMNYLQSHPEIIQNLLS